MAAISKGNMKRFSFSQPNHFDSTAFYEKYKTAEFLRNIQNIKSILIRGHQLQQSLDALEPGQMLTIEGMFIKPQVPLVVKKSGCTDDSDLDNEDFTFPRLSGLAAAVLLKTSLWYNEKIYLSESEALGIKWTNEFKQRQLYLSAVTGAELFVEQFDFFPLLCALRKYQLKKISLGSLIKIAMIPHFRSEELMVVRLRNNYEIAKQDSMRFGLNFNIKNLITTAPALQSFFKDI